MVTTVLFIVLCFLFIVIPPIAIQVYFKSAHSLKGYVKADKHISADIMMFWSDQKYKEQYEQAGLTCFELSLEAIDWIKSMAEVLEVNGEVYGKPSIVEKQHNLALSKYNLEQAKAVGATSTLSVDSRAGLGPIRASYEGGKPAPFNPATRIGSPFTELESNLDKLKQQIDHEKNTLVESRQSSIDRDQYLRYMGGASSKRARDYYKKNKEHIEQIRHHTSKDRYENLRVRLGENNDPYVDWETFIETLSEAEHKFLKNCQASMDKDGNLDYHWTLNS